jgi:hypothetical protein
MYLITLACNTGHSVRSFVVALRSERSKLCAKSCFVENVFLQRDSGLKTTTLRTTEGKLGSLQRMDRKSVRKDLK